MFNSRRSVLRLLGASTLLPLLNCTDGTTGADDDDGVDAATGGDGSSSGTCAQIPSETAGPYPGDGTNGANALSLSGINRRDIRTSIGSASGTAPGIVLTVTLTVVDVSAGCTPLANHAVYLWHCDRAGAYSMYSGSAQAENYLRGVQVSDASGQVTFTTTFPGCYSGRWPHIHFEVYETLAQATNGANKLYVSQLALPESACDVVYATSGYEASVSNLNQISLSSDNVFSDDDGEMQLATTNGSAASGFTATLQVGI